MGAPSAVAPVDLTLEALDRAVNPVAVRVLLVRLLVVGSGLKGPVRYKIWT